MQVFKGRSCRLLFKAFFTADSIIYTLQHKPGGSLFWLNLPVVGRHNKTALRKSMAHTILSSLFDEDFIALLLRSALDEKGKPLGSGELYTWLLGNIYAGDVKMLYGDWLAVKGSKG